MKKTKLIIPLIIGTILVFSCSGDDDESQPLAVESVTLDKPTMALGIGESETLEATVKPVNAQDKTVTWSSDKTSVATVSPTGEVTGVSVGEAVITVTTKDGGKTATCTVTVSHNPLEITFTQPEVFEVGETKEVSYTVTKGQPTDVTVSEVPEGWEVRIDKDNNLIIIVCDITYPAGGKDGQAKITVTDANGQSLDFPLELKCSAPKSIYVESGTLQEVIEGRGMTDAEDLILEGTLDKRDFNFMRDGMPNLANLDIRAVSITEIRVVSTIYPADEFPTGAFQLNTSGVYGKETIRSVIFPESITSIGMYALTTNKMETLEIPAGVTSIGIGAFFGCTELRGDLVLPDGLTNLGSFAFINCSGFTGTLRLPQNLKKIEQRTFSNCSGFTGALVIPDGVTEIGDFAFYNCVGFDGILTLPQNLKKIGQYAFRECSGFTGSLVIPEGITRIEESAFNNCSGFTGSLVIPDGVTEIEGEAFVDCTGFDGTLTLPQNLMFIRQYAFENCNFTGSLIIPPSVIGLGDYTFSGCDSFDDVHVYWQQPATYSSYMFPVNKTVYVPSGTKELYEAETGWSPRHIIVERD